MNKFKWGKQSMEEWDTVDPDIKRVFDRALSWGLIDMTAVEGRRIRATQNRYHRIGRSKVKWPHSKHNVSKPEDLAKAIDIAPFVNNKISWNKYHCIYLSGIIMAAAKIEKVKIRWGGNWDRDTEVITDQDFQDLVHYEKVE